MNFNIISIRDMLSLKDYLTHPKCTYPPPHNCLEISIIISIWSDTDNLISNKNSVITAERICSTSLALFS